MPRSPLMRWVTGASLAAVAVGSAGLVEQTLDTREVVVYFDDAQVSPDQLQAELLAEFGVVRVKRVFERRLVTGDARKLSAMVAVMKSERRNMSAAEWATWKQQIEKNVGVTGAERHQKRALVGAPRGTDWPQLNAVQADIASQEAMTDVLAGQASSKATGAGIKVAVLDGGFDTSHEAVSPAILGGYDAIDDDNDVDDLGNGIDDDNDGLTDLNVGHGTFVASLIHAVAPDAKILPIRVLDDEGHGTNLALWLGISKAVSEGADVINMSLVADTMPQGLMDAIDDATDADITMVISAGNDPAGPLNDGYMANHAVVVGGVDNNGALLSWSPTGGTVDVYAPAEGILGAIGGAGPDANSYATWDGTSFAAAFVSAGAALAKELDSSLTSAQMEAHLKGCVSPMTGANPPAEGIIDLAAVSN